MEGKRELTKEEIEKWRIAREKEHKEYFEKNKGMKTNVFVNGTGNVQLVFMNDVDWCCFSFGMGNSSELGDRIKDLKKNKKLGIAICAPDRNYRIDYVSLEHLEELHREQIQRDKQSDKQKKNKGCDLICGEISSLT